MTHFLLIKYTKTYNYPKSRKICLEIRVTIIFMMQQPPGGKSLLIIENSRSHSDTLHSVVPFGRVISPTHTLLLNKTQHSQRRVIHVPEGFEPKIPADKRPLTHALERAATGIGIESSAIRRNLGKCL